MILFTMLFGVMAAALAAEASRLKFLLKGSRAEAGRLAERLAVPPPPPPPSVIRIFECRREHLGLLWFLVLSVDEEGRRVLRVSSGLPHCPRCVLPLKLIKEGRAEFWTCAGCEARHPEVNADLRTTDRLLTACLQEFFVRHPDYSPAESLAAPQTKEAASSPV